MHCLWLLAVAHAAWQSTLLPCDYESALERARDAYVTSFADCIRSRMPHPGALRVHTAVEWKLRHEALEATGVFEDIQHAWVQSAGRSLPATDSDGLFGALDRLFGALDRLFAALGHTVLPLCYYVALTCILLPTLLLVLMSCASVGVGRQRHRVPPLARTPAPRDLGDCTICLESIVANAASFTLRCSHAYHAECLERWAAVRPVCPNCNVETDELREGAGPSVMGLDHFMD